MLDAGSVRDIAQVAELCYTVLGNKAPQPRSRQLSAWRICQGLQSGE